MSASLNRTVPLVLAILFFAGCSKTPEVENLRAFTETQAAFEQAEKLPMPDQAEAFRRVAARYQGLVDRGVKSGPVYYNMGNAWFRGDEPGKALAAYYTARRYLPLDPHIASNIQTVLGSAGAVAADEGAATIVEYLFFWQDWVGVRQKALVSFWFALATLLCGVIALFVRHRRLSRLTLVFLALTLVFLASTSYDWYRFEHTRYALVSTDQASPRKGNSEQYELSFTTPVSFGTTATVLDARGDWLRLRFGSGRDGWLPKSQVVEY